ncbi:MAG: nuclear transport factor 2 family protein [Acidobacteriota bacterium]
MPYSVPVCSALRSFTPGLLGLGLLLTVAAGLSAESRGTEPDTSSSAEAPAASAAPTEALESADRAYNAAASQRDRQGLGALLTDDAVFFAETTHRGRAAFLDAWAPLWTAKYDFSYRATTLEATVAASGELGYALGTVTTSFRRPGLDEETVTESHYLNLWRHDDSGWRLAASTALVVHPELGAAREPRSGLMTAWPRLADQVGSAITLEWTPDQVENASSGELRVVAGTYTARFDDGEQEHTGGGDFLAVWRRDADGGWQLAAEGYTPPDLHNDP